VAGPALALVARRSEKAAAARVERILNIWGNLKGK
jgi:hypothetical protein